MNPNNLETPAVIIDRDVVDRNIARCQGHFDKCGIKLRAHIKTHKLPVLAQAQVEAGSNGITCQKISEAAVMADAGLMDIMISYNIVGQSKLDRLVALSKRISHLSLVADNPAVVQGLSAAFSNEPRHPDVLVECDTGGGRCGVQSPEQARELAAQIFASPGLRFKGLMTFPAVNSEPEVDEFFIKTLSLLSDAGIPCQEVSGGGSAGLWRAERISSLTEYRAGTYVYGDRSMVHRGVYGLEDCALTILATVVSTPTPNRAIIDAGSKVLSSDLLGLDGYGYIKGHPDLRIRNIAEEHGTIIHENGATELTVGDRLEIIPNHCCVVSNLVGVVTFVSGGKVTSTVPVEARGKIT